MPSEANRWAGTLANLHIQKAGGTAQFKNCEQHCLEARRRLDLNALGHDVWSRASGTRCGCEALFDHHWGAAELEAIQSVARAHEVQLELMTVLRDPVARVLSEYSYLLHNRGAMTQDQWDYTDRRVVRARAACSCRRSPVASLSSRRGATDSCRWRSSSRWRPAGTRLTTGRHATSTAFDALRGARKAAAAILLAQGS